MGVGGVSVAVFLPFCSHYRHPSSQPHNIFLDYHFRFPFSLLLVPVSSE